MTKATAKTALTLSAAVFALGGVAAPAGATMDNHSEMKASADVATVGGAEMYPTKTIVENASNSPIHTTLVAAVKAADLVETLSSDGPFTVFAPTNAAFEKLPDGTVDMLLKPESKRALTTVLAYHVVPGNVSAAQLIEMIEAGGGTATLNTAVEGATLTAQIMDGNVVLTDARGGTATVTQADVVQSNGVIHVTDSVSLPG